jgi:radical SAM superfamily enzyme YgiQ (UPF0313 family)
MKSKVLITHSYFLSLDPKQWKQAQPYAPLGTLVAAAVVREAGFPISFYDSMFAVDNSAFKLELQKKLPNILVIYDDGFNYLTKMCLTNMRGACFEMIKIAKQFNCKVIVSSSDSTDHYQDYLNCGADFVIKGEGEETLLAILNALENNESNFESIDGLFLKSNEQILKTKDRSVMKDLDKLPFAAWDLLNIQPYREMWMQSRGFFSMNMYTTRGCPYKCNWCAKPIYGNRYNVRSPRKVVEELKLVQALFKANHIWFSDDIFGLKPGWVAEFNKELAHENIKVRYKIQSRVDLLLKDEAIRDLANSGCEEVWVGAESGSQRILDAMDKGTSVEQIVEATLLMKKYHIKPCYFIQFGYLGEDWSDIQKTLSLVLKMMPHDIGVSVSYPLPGTLFYEKVKAELTVKSNWTDSDELALMFKNTFPKEFYKILQRFLHRSFRSEQAKLVMMELLSDPSKISMAKLKKVASYAVHKPVSFLNSKRLKQFEAINVN